MDKKFKTSLIIAKYHNETVVIFLTKVMRSSI